MGGSCGLGAKGGLALTSGFSDGLACWLLSCFLESLSFSNSLLVLVELALLARGEDGSFPWTAGRPFQFPLRRLAFFRSASSASARDSDKSKEKERERHQCIDINLSYSIFNYINVSVLSYFAIT